MSVVKSRRKESRFEAQHHFYRLRTDVTRLLLQDFGFDDGKYRETIERYRKNHEAAPNVDEIVGRWEKKSESFNRWFIDEECSAIMDILRNIEREFTMGNSIYPSDTPARFLEFCLRRWHIDKAIGYCYTLKQELNYVIRVLPVDINKYERFATDIDEQIALYKGVRQADNRLVKPKKSTKFDEDVVKTFDGLAGMMHWIGKLEAIKDKQ